MTISKAQERAANFIGGDLTPLGYEQITDLSSADTLTVPTGAKIAILNPTGQAVRWRDDGTNPTATIGMLIGAGSSFIYTGNLSAISFIQQTATAVLNISYYK